MAIHTQHAETNSSGHSKSIDEAGIMLVFDTLQKYQYSYPIKSVVRELLSNGLDSVTEKKVALEILSGKAKVEDYFADLEGPLYKDSKFNPDYYNPEWLSDNDNVYMTYHVGTAFEKDKVVFHDWGVGLFGKRLEGYFNIAYSTKRLSKLPLGKFGLGAKSPLSTQIDFYTVESRYNGMLFRFNVYDSAVDSLIPKINLETNTVNDFILFNEGQKGINEDGTEWSNEYPVYWQPTTEKNGVTITLEVKKHHKVLYIDALKSQMLYFDNIVLTVIEGGNTSVIPYKAEIMYEDDLIVISNNKYYSKPHLLLNKVNYGYVAWDELELEEKIGNIGIKVAPEDVEVNPSRESVLWTEKTKHQILQRFNQAVDIAAGMIQKELNATDIVAWIRACYSTYGRYTEKSGVIGILAKIVDLSKAKLKFASDESIEFFPTDVFHGLYARSVTVFEEKDASKVRKKKVLRKEISSLLNVANLPIYLMEKGERAVNRRDKWLHHNNPSGFITISEPFSTIEEAEKAGISEEEKKKMYADKGKTRFKFWEYLKASAYVSVYKDVEVPEEYKADDNEVEEVVEKTIAEKKDTTIAKLTAEQRRKQQGKTLISTPYLQVPVGYDHRTGIIEPFDFKRFEIPVSSINNWTAKEVYYCHDADTELLKLVCYLTMPTTNRPGRPARPFSNNPSVFTTKKWWRLNKSNVEGLGLSADNAFHLQFFFDTEVVLIKVNQNSAKYYRDFYRLREFFIRIENKTITMSNRLIRWNTARLIKGKLHHCAFLYNFPFNERLNIIYTQLCNYVDTNYRSLEGMLEEKNTYSGLSKETYDDMVAHLDNVHNFQKFVQSRPNDHSGIALLAEKLFNNKELVDGMAVDLTMMKKLEELLEYSEAAGSLFNSIPVLTGYSSTYGVAPAYDANTTQRNKRSIPEELESEIRKLLEQKGILQYDSPQEDTTNTIS